MLLDTCAFLWLAAGDEHLSPEALERIENAPIVYVSCISAFEIGLKCRSGKLRLPVPAAEWFESIVAHHNLSVLSLDWKVCIAATDLPPIHKDPCDRFIIATAKSRRLPVVTGDPVFASHGIEVVS